MNVPCNTIVRCDCDPNPFQNLSAELPDQDRFFAIANFEDSPPLGEGSWTQNSCRTVCYSTVSQADADQCALRLAQECTWGTWRKAPTRPNRLGDPQQIYANAPQSCTVFCSDGSPFTFTAGVGLFLALSQEQADHNAYGYACKQAEAHKICLSDINPSACLGTFYETVIAAFGEFLGDSNDWEIASGALPPGLTFHGGVTPGIDVTIDGTPTAAGTYGFSVRVTAPDGDSVTRAYSITVATITSDVLPDAVIAMPYPPYQFTQTGLNNPIWLLEVGTLPDGLTLDQSGIISGTPTTNETTAFTVSATDTNAQCLKSFTLTVNAGCGTPFFKIDGYGPATAAAIDALIGGLSNPSALPEWDGKLRLVNGDYSSNPVCYAINGKAITVVIPSVAGSTVTKRKASNCNVGTGVGCWYRCGTGGCFACIGSPNTVYQTTDGSTPPASETLTSRTFQITSDFAAKNLIRFGATIPGSYQQFTDNYYDGSSPQSGQYTVVGAVVLFPPCDYQGGESVGTSYGTSFSISAV